MRINGLARLLVLEKISNTTERDTYLSGRRDLRARNNSSRRVARRKRLMKGDLKAEDEYAGLETNNYENASFHIPYGPRFDAKKIDKIVYSTVGLSVNCDWLG